MAIVSDSYLFWPLLKLLMIIASTFVSLLLVAWVGLRAWSAK